MIIQSGGDTTLKGAQLIGKPDKLATSERVKRNIQETRKGNATSNFNQHAQLEREINKLKSADEINFADGMGKFTDSMNDKAFSRLVKSVKENGFTNPVVEYVEINGKGVQADTRNLHIESVQDTETYQSKTAVW